MYAGATAVTGIIITIQTIDTQSYVGRIFNSWTEYRISKFGTNYNYQYL